MGHENNWISKESYGRFMPGVVTAPLKDREVLVLRAVLKALDVKDIDVWNYRSGGMLFAQEASCVKGQGTQWTDAEFYRYLLAEVCEYDESGGLKGLPEELCEDFYGLCEMHHVYPSDYSYGAVQEGRLGNVEYVITTYYKFCLFCDE